MARPNAAAMPILALRPFQRKLPARMNSVAKPTAAKAMVAREAVSVTAIAAAATPIFAQPDLPVAMTQAKQGRRTICVIMPSRF